MIITNNILKNNLKTYSNKNNKINRKIKSGELIPIKKGLYETENKTPGYLLASSIYGPSYLSFDYALSYYGLIPEKVVAYTSATFDKKKKKQFENYFGSYLYRDVPKNVYWIGVKLIEENGYSYQIATPEKALCDKLYILNPIKNISEFKTILLDDLRIDFKELMNLNVDEINEISKLYHCTNVKLLYNYIRRNKN